jgi:leucyl aminopeptidase (aminopeptidase T)
MAGTLDSLYARVARKVLTESLSVKKGTNVTVEVWNNGLPFARHVIVEARKLGAVPLLLFEDERAYVDGVKKGDKTSVGVMGKHERSLLANTDVYVFVPGPTIGVYSKRLSAQQRGNSTRYNQDWYKAAKKARLRGVRFPYGYLGRDASNVLDVPSERLIAHHLRAALVDYAQIGRQARRLASKLNDGTGGTLSTPDAKLTFTFRGELEIDDGVVDKDDVAEGNNMTAIPPGNVFKGVEPNSATGNVRVGSFRNVFGQVDGAVLTFEKGRLKVWRSEKSQGVLDSMYSNLKEKDRTLYGFTVGLNPKIRFGYGINQSSTDGIVMSCGGRGIPIAAPSLTAGGRTLISKGTIK